MFHPAQHLPQNIGKIQNPVLPGFNPDPSFLRVGPDFYLATSTFEWFPGVQIHHSRDLVHWRLLGHALTSRAQLDLRGIADSAGVWAPSLSWDRGCFHLVFTLVRTAGAGRPFKDTPNYLITAQTIEGPWSAPLYLNSSGFDPSLFHDEDGRMWLLNIQWDFRKGHPRFAGILLQEYSEKEKRLVGMARCILEREELIEGPNLYRRNGYYYLMVAQGGTSWNHAVAMLRSRSIEGPYEADPQPFVLTARGNPSLALQKAGHGELVPAQGRWYLAHLCSRPVGQDRRCILGRETALQEVAWTEDNWLRLVGGGWEPQVEVAAPEELSPVPWPPVPVRDEFSGERLGPHWSSLRVPIEESWASLKQRPGWLRLRGRESLFSLFEQSLIARRLQAFHSLAETCLEFFPIAFNQMAGLICYYDTKTHYYLRVTHDEKLGRVVGVVLTDDTRYDELTESQVCISDWQRCYLRAEINREFLQFHISPDGQQWRSIGPVLDATRLSDDYGEGLHFTGAFVGICAQDMGGASGLADFDYFELKTLP